MPHNSGTPGEGVLATHSKSTQSFHFWPRNPTSKNLVKIYSKMYENHVHTRIFTELLLAAKDRKRPKYSGTESSLMRLRSAPGGVLHSGEQGSAISPLSDAERWQGLSPAIVERGIEGLCSPRQDGGRRNMHAWPVRLPRGNTS